MGLINLTMNVWMTEDCTSIEKEVNIQDLAWEGTTEPISVFL